MTTLTRRVEQRAANMAAMMLHLDIWPETSFADLPMESAIRACCLCREVDQCSHWLAHSKADPIGLAAILPQRGTLHASAPRIYRRDLRFDDPMIQLVMASDGVRREDLERLIERLRSRSYRRRSPAGPRIPPRA
jgi:hypothetical protein